jgi:hypothetical protein
MMVHFGSSVIGSNRMKQMLVDLLAGSKDGNTKDTLANSGTVDNRMMILDRTILVEGQLMTLRQFFADNEDSIGHDEQSEIISDLDRKGEYYGGGGAFDDFLISFA